MEAKVKVNTPILIHNTEHRNFVETDKIVPEGTIMEGERINIIGKRKGKEFVYRLFKDKDGILIYEKNIEPMEINLNANGEADTRVVTLPSVKNDPLNPWTITPPSPLDTPKKDLKECL